jgi:hypothetical protein
MTRRLFVIAVLFGWTSVVLANAGPPRTPKAEAGKTKFKIELDENAKEPKLYVPANLAGGKGDGKLAAADLPPMHWILSGLALTVGLALGGVWMVRKGPSKAAWVVAPLLVAATASLLLADLPPGRGRGPVPQPAPALPVYLEGTITVEAVPNGDTIRLVLDKVSFEKLKKDPAAPVPGRKGDED